MATGVEGAIRGAVRGALVGVAATWAMDRVDMALHRLEPASSRRRTRAVRPEGKDPVHLEASHVSEALGRGLLPESHPAGLAVYYAIDIAASALYGAARASVPALAAGRGAAFGVGRFVVEDKVVNPLSGLSAAPWRYPWQAHGRQLAALVTHGLVTDALLRLLDDAVPPAGLSLRARAAQALLPLTGIRRAYRDGQTLRADVARGRRREPALPSAGLRRRCRVEEGTVGGMRVFTVAPRDEASSGVVLYLHGGAFVRDVMRSQWRFAERLATRTGATIVVPLYPLAPEHDDRAVAPPLRALYARLVERHGGERLTLLGDSAGGGLTLALAQAVRDAGEEAPSRLVLLSPWLDLALSDPAQPGLARTDPMLDAPGLHAAAAWHAGDRDPGDPALSPLFGSLDGLPPIALFTGTNDLVYPDSRRLRDRARHAGARLLYREYPGLFHVWPLADIPEGRQAIDEMAAFIAQPLTSTPDERSSIAR